MQIVPYLAGSGECKREGFFLQGGDDTVIVCLLQFCILRKNVFVFHQ